MYFEVNRGQASESVRYLSRAPGYTLWLTDRHATLALTPNQADADSPTIVRMRLVNGNPDAAWEAHEKLPGQIHYLKGRYSKDSLTHIPTYGSVVQKQAYPGIDLIYRGNPQKLEYDLAVEPGRDPAIIRIGFDGVKHLAIDRHGDLLLTLADSRLIRQHKPIIYRIRLGRESKANHDLNRLLDKPVGSDSVGYENIFLSLVGS